MSDADDEATKGVEMLAVTDTSSSVEQSSQTKRNADVKQCLQKKQKSASSSLSTELEALSLPRQEQIADDKNYKIMQPSYRGVQIQSLIGVRRIQDRYFRTRADNQNGKAQG